MAESKEPPPPVPEPGPLVAASQEPPPPVPAPAPVAGAQEPTSSGPKPTWSAQLEKASKLVLLASIVVYVLGYAVAASHFTSAGVPSTELSHNVFVGAGLLFVGVTGLGLLAWQTVVLIWRRSGKGKYGSKIWWAFFLPGLAGSAISQLMQRRGWPSPPWEHGYMLLMGLFAVVFHARPAHQVPSSVMAGAIIAAIFSITFFSATLYPFVPQAFGGGSPTRLFVWNAGSPPPSFPKPISEFSCPPDPTRPATCRIVSLVFSSSSQDYFAVEERQAKCGEAPRLKAFSWPRGSPLDGLFSHSHFCFIRLASSETKQLPIPAL